MGRRDGDAGDAKDAKDEMPCICIALARSTVRLRQVFRRAEELDQSIGDTAPKLVLRDAIYAHVPKRAVNAEKHANTNVSQAVSYGM
jgi:hypothetical protein